MSRSTTTLNILLRLMTIASLAMLIFMKVININEGSAENLELFMYLRQTALTILED